MESWVVIKKGKQLSKVPYQAFKDVFEQCGFVIVDNLSGDPTFSHSNTEKVVENADVETNNNLNEEVKASERPKRNKSQNNRNR